MINLSEQLKTKNRCIKLLHKKELLKRIEKYSGSKTIIEIVEAVFSGKYNKNKINSILGAVYKIDDEIYFTSAEKNNVTIELDANDLITANISKGYLSLKLNGEMKGESFTLDIFSNVEVLNNLLSAKEKTLDKNNNELIDNDTIEIINTLKSFEKYSQSGYFMKEIANDLMVCVKMCMHDDIENKQWEFLYNIISSIHPGLSSMGNDFGIGLPALKEIYNNISNDYIALPTLKVLREMDEEHGTVTAETLASTYFRCVQWIVKSDGKVSEAEKDKLKELARFLYVNNENYASNQNSESKDHKSKEVKSIEEEEKPETLEDVLKDLDNLIGMKNIKDQISTYINLIKVQKERISRGMPVSDASLHAVFYGPPGTGKTTIARIIGRIYKVLGMLDKGHIIETDRAGIVAGYVGQTAIKVDEIVTKARGGILFIDEAYTLAPESTGNDFGQEAIDTILKRMEDYRDNLVVVVAGYPDEMKRFISSNPGLKSRFSRYFYFDHYTPEELLSIFEIFVKKAAFKLSENSKKETLEIFKIVYEGRTKSFGNGRFVRNFFEKIIEKQANRIAEIVPLTDEILSTIKKDDIPTIKELNNN